MHNIRGTSKRQNEVSNGQCRSEPDVRPTTSELDEIRKCQQAADKPFCWPPDDTRICVFEKQTNITIWYYFPPAFYKPNSNVTTSHPGSTGLFVHWGHRFSSNSMGAPSGELDVYEGFNDIFDELDQSAPGERLLPISLVQIPDPPFGRPDATYPGPRLVLVKKEGEPPIASSSATGTATSAPTTTAEVMASPTATNSTEAASLDPARYTQEGTCWPKNTEITPNPTELAAIRECQEAEEPEKPYCWPPDGTRICVSVSNNGTVTSNVTIHYFWSPNSYINGSKTSADIPSTAPQIWYGYWHSDVPSTNGEMSIEHHLVPLPGVDPWDNSTQAADGKTVKSHILDIEMQEAKFEDSNHHGYEGPRFILVTDKPTSRHDENGDNANPDPTTQDHNSQMNSKMIVGISIVVIAVAVAIAMVLYYQYRRRQFLQDREKRESMQRPHQTRQVSAMALSSSDTIVGSPEVRSMASAGTGETEVQSLSTGGTRETELLPVYTPACEDEPPEYRSTISVVLRAP